MSGRNGPIKSRASAGRPGRETWNAPMLGSSRAVRSGPFVREHRVRERQAGIHWIGRGAALLAIGLNMDRIRD